MRIIALFVLTISSFLASSQTTPLRNEVSLAADKLQQQVIEWRRDIHEHPELGNHEVRTAALIEKHLRSLGMEVKTSVAHTGVVGILKGGKPGPVVALRADMDALPVIERTPVPFASKVKTQFNG